MFINKQKNKAGINALRLFIRGKPWVFVVDNFLLYKSVRGVSEIPVFAGPGPTGSFWVPILEKALAKVYGNYLQIGKNTVNILHSILGVPTFVF